MGTFKTSHQPSTNSPPSSFRIKGLQLHPFLRSLQVPASLGLPTPLVSTVISNFSHHAETQDHLPHLTNYRSSAMSPRDLQVQQDLEEVSLRNVSKQARIRNMQKMPIKHLCKSQGFGHNVAMSPLSTERKQYPCFIKMHALSKAPYPSVLVARNASFVHQEFPSVMVATVVNTNKPNLEACIPCPPGQRATPDRKGCIDAGCPPGKEFDFNTCRDCEYRMFRNSSMSTCQACPPRTTLLNFRKPHVKFQNCLPGYFLTDIVVRTSEGVPACEKCPPGSTTKGFMKPFCRRHGEPYPENTFQDSKGDCQVFDSNYRYDPVKNACIKCARGEVSTGGVVTKCKKCLPGQISDFGFCECPIGTELRNGRCRICLAGTFKGEFVDECFQCSNDEFSAPGSSKCSKCPPGSTSTESRGRSCKKVVCDKGFVPPPFLTYFFADNVCVSRMAGCPKGLFSINDFSTWILCGDKDGNVVCPKGHIFDKIDFCITCSPGSRRVETMKGTLTCRDCPFRAPVSRGGTSRKCRSCSNGFAPNDDRLKCVCPFGRFVSKDGLCTKCPAGKRNMVPKG